VYIIVVASESKVKTNEIQQKKETKTTDIDYGLLIKSIYYPCQQQEAIQNRRASRQERLPIFKAKNW